MASLSPGWRGSWPRPLLLLLCAVLLLVASAVPTSAVPEPGLATTLAGEVAESEGEGTGPGATEPDEDRASSSEEDAHVLRENLVGHLKDAIENGKVKVLVQTKTVDKAADVVVMKGGSLDSFERDNQFIVGVSSTASPFPVEEVSSARKVVVTNFEGERLQCFVPIVQQGQEEGDEGGSEGEDVGDLAGLLGGDVGKSHRHQDGWWTYEVCPLVHVRQFHAEGEQGFNLGRFKRSLVEDRGVSLVYDSGDVCDVTGEMRETTVRFTCSGTASGIQKVVETSSCAYLVDFASQELCKVFPEQSPTLHNILCTKE